MSFTVVPAMEVFEFDSGMLHFRFVTLGGSRRERKKWAGCFEHETSLMFVVDVSAYDQKLFEDRHISRIQYDRKAFDDVINSKWFRDNDVYLVFNRYDLFKEKIARVDLGTCFADYKEGSAPNFDKQQDLHFFCLKEMIVKKPQHS